MAFMEGKLQPIDLIAALQARRQMQQTAEQQKQQQLQNELLKEQVKAAEWENLKAREVPTMTVPSSGLTGMPTKKFLHEMPGYISGVDPTTVFNQWNQNFRQGMTAGGGYSRPGETESETAMNMANANLADEQAKQLQYKRQGYGSGGGGGTPGAVSVSGSPVNNVNPAELLGLVKSGNAIQTPEEAGAYWQADRDAEAAQNAANLAAQNYLAGGGESTLNGLSPETQLALRGVKSDAKTAEKEQTKLEQFGKEVYSKAQSFIDKMYKNPEFIKLGKTPQGQALQEKMKSGLLSTVGRAYQAGEPFILDEYINQNIAPIYSK